MSKVTFNIDEKLKKWLRDIAEESMVFGNMSDVALFCMKYVQKNPGVIPK